MTRARLARTLALALSAGLLLALNTSPAAAAIPATAVAHHAHRKSHKRKQRRSNRTKCPKGEVRLAQRRHSCIRQPKLAEPGKRALQSMSFALGSLRNARLDVRSGSHLSGRQLRALRRGAFGSKGARVAALALRKIGSASSARAAAADPSSSGRSGGWSYSASSSGGQVAVQAARHVGAEVQVFRRKSSQKLSVDPCPSSAGKVNGRVQRRELTMAGDKLVAGLRLQASVLAVLDDRTVGHVGDDAHLHSYDIRGQTRVTVRVAVYKGRRRVAWVPTLHDTFSHVQHISVNGRLSSVSDHGRVSLTHGLVRRASGKAFDEFRDEFNYADQLWQATFEDLRARFASVQASSWLNGRCISVTLTPAAAEVDPGATTTITATIKPAGGGSGAPGTFRASTNAGTISPVSGAYQRGKPIALTFTAPRTGTAQITVDSISRQGTGSGQTEVKVKPKGYEVIYSHNSWQDDNLHYATTIEEYDEQLSSQYVLSSVIPLSGDPAQGGATGAAPLSYEQASYVEVVSGYFPGLYSSPKACQGTETTDIVSTQNGTARVLNLSIANGKVALDFTPGRFDDGTNGPPNETYKSVESATPVDPDHTPDYACVSWSQDPAPLFLGDFDDYYELENGWGWAGPGPAIPGDPIPTSEEHVYLNQGWQPGDGGDHYSGPGQVLYTLKLTKSWNPDPNGGFVTNSSSNETYFDTFQIVRLG